MVRVITQLCSPSFFMSSIKACGDTYYLIVLHRLIHCYKLSYGKFIHEQSSYRVSAKYPVPTKMFYQVITVSSFRPHESNVYLSIENHYSKGSFLWKVYLSMEAICPFLNR